MYAQRKRRPHSKYPVNKNRAPYIYTTNGYKFLKLLLLYKLWNLVEKIRMYGTMFLKI